MICEISFPAYPATQDDALRRARSQLRFTRPVQVHVARTIDEVLPVLDAVETAKQRGHWCVGFVAYEAAEAFDVALTTQQANTPLAWFAEYAEAQEIAAPDPESEEFALGEWESDTVDAAFDKSIDTIRAAIREGDYYQVNFTTRLSTTFSGQTHSFFRALQRHQPRGYQCFIDCDEFALCSVSPELFFSLRERTITTQPMKGTTARGDTKEEDDARANYLLTSEKERAENLMIVDLLRNDLSRIAEPGSVSVPQLFGLYAYPSVWQMTSTVQAELRAGLTLGDIFRALFPCGSVTGAPKIAAMRAIAQLERAPRGIYCGAIGFVAPDGNACFNVGIRSVWIDRRGTDVRATCGVGSGITYDSTALGEAEEVWFKSRFVRRASKAFALFETLRLEAGVYHLLELHLARIAHSAKHFGFRFDLAACERALTQVQRAHATGVWRVKLVVERDGVAVATAAQLDDTHVSDSPLPVSLAAAAVDSRDEFLAHKTTRREAYDTRWRAGAFDTLLFNERGELTEFTRANVAIEFAGDAKRYTPPLRAGLLNGTLRQAALARGELAERPLHGEDLTNAKRLWWFNGLRGWVEVSLDSTVPRS